MRTRRSAGSLGGRPRGLDPPRDPRLGEGAHDLHRPIRVVARRLSLPHDVEGTIRPPVLLDVPLYGPDVLRGDLPPRRVAENPVVAEGAPHGPLARPRPNHPDGDTRRPHRQDESAV